MVWALLNDHTGPHTHVPPNPRFRVMTAGVKGGVKLDQMSVWEVGLGSECGVWSGGRRSGLWTALRPERKTPHYARDVVVI